MIVPEMFIRENKFSRTQYGKKMACTHRRDSNKWLRSEVGLWKSQNIRNIPVTVFCFLLAVSSVVSEQIPSFSKLKEYYPGYAHYGGVFNNHQLIEAIGCDTSHLLHDTSALRLSVTLNKIGGVHSLGKELIRLSKYGRDSVSGNDGLQYIYHPIAYGPYLADKYGYPTVSKLHELDPLDTKKNFWGKQGLLRVITYTKKQNMPKGHVALWDCNHFYQAQDWIAGHSLITVEFWQSPDSDCSHMIALPPPPAQPDVTKVLSKLKPGAKPAKLRHRHWEKKFIRKYYQLHKQE